MNARQFITSILICCFPMLVMVPTIASADEKSWAEYEKMLSGSLLPAKPKPKPVTAPAPPPPPPPPPPKLAPPSWAPNFKVTLVTKSFRTGKINVGIHNVRENEDYYLAVGEISGTNQNLKVESVEFDENEVATIMLSKDGGEAEEFVMEDVYSGPSGGGAKPKLPTPTRPGARPSPRQTRPAGRPNFPTRSPRTNTPAATYKGADVERHLQEYQKAAIRQGLPPLPVPLPDADIEELQREGHLQAAPAAPSTPGATPGASSNRGGFRGRSFRR